MDTYEKLGLFYLGRRVDPQTKEVTADLLMLDSRDLTTHAVCVGMTGSGKTGLCIGLLEEAAIDQIPAIVIDPKGDITNLMLLFPELTAEAFLPWINLDEARNKGMTPEAFAAAQAALWKKGLAEWGQDENRIRRLRESVDLTVYTPGSTAGIPISVLKRFTVPPETVRNDAELFQETVSSTATGLLTLLGLEADPVQSREHIFLANLIQHAWRQGTDLDLPALIAWIQQPPLSRIGILNIDAFYPPSERFGLAMKLNNLLAAPGFQTWLEGEPMDVQRFLYLPDGKPRISIFSIAHLQESERMFFVTLLLNHVLSWMRTRSGTTSLRALVYMDEIFGYFPPVANPPSKRPMLTLLKQARAYGIGMVLATQNPVDLDYKGLSNTGIWFIGRLQTEQDRARVLDGLQGAAGAAGASFDRRTMEALLAGLGKRVFLMNNVHEREPVLFHTRWVMSYLRGPLTRQQIRTLMQTRRQAQAPAEIEAHAAGGTRAIPAVELKSQELLPARPVLPAQVPQAFLPIQASKPPDAVLVYRPRLFASARIRFRDTRLNVDEDTRRTFLLDIPRRPSYLEWDTVEWLDVDLQSLQDKPHDDAYFVDVPSPALQSRNYPLWEGRLRTWLAAECALQLRRNADLKVVSQPGESEEAFKVRLREAAREQRDAAVEKLRKKYAATFSTLEDRLRRARHRVEREAEQAKQQKVQTLISVGTTLLGALLGRKAVSRSTLGRATTSARGVGRIFKEKEDVARAEETLEALEARLRELEAQFESEVAKVRDHYEQVVETVETVTIKPKKTQTQIDYLGLVWVPYWQQGRHLEPAYRPPDAGSSGRVAAL